MTIIAHLSDPHFGTVDDIVRQALLRELRERPPDLILLSGDITQRARARQFREARAFIEELPPVPRLAIPGNHDIPLYDLFTRFTRPYRLYRRFVATELEPSYADDDLAVLCVNATRATRRKHGVVSARQIEQTAARLAQLRQRFRIVAIHQPLAVTLPRDENNLVRGARQALERWIPAGADLFLAGHIHLPYCTAVRSQNGGRSAVILNAGTTLSRRVRHGVPNSYNLIRLEHDGAARRMCLERRDFDAALQCFALHQVHTAREAPEGWTLELQDRAA